MLRLSFVVLAGAIASFACNPAPPPEREARKGATSSIVNGDPSTDDQDAVVYVLNEQAQESCSGTLIAPNLVLTARHCVSELTDDGACGGVESDYPAEAMTIETGVDADGNDPDADVIQIFHGPDQDLDCGNDVAFLQLDHDLNIPPRAIRFTAPVVGEEVMVVGYGIDENEEPTDGRYQRTGMTVLALAGSTFTYTQADGNSEDVDVADGTVLTTEGACHGDSGGPLFDGDGNILGVVHSGGLQEDVCVDSPDVFILLAQHETLIRSILDQVGHPLEAAFKNAARAPRGAAPPRRRATPSPRRASPAPDPAASASSS
jgi:secreted trypsin-like serine protease